MTPITVQDVLAEPIRFEHKGEQHCLTMEGWSSIYTWGPRWINAIIARAVALAEPQIRAQVEAEYEEIRCPEPWLDEAFHSADCVTCGGSRKLYRKVSK